MRTNTAVKPVLNHEGLNVRHLPPIEELKRTALACLLWEDNFYESGESVAERIKKLVPLCAPEDVANLAIEAREKQRLRHLPLFLVRELARDSKRCHNGLIATTLCRVIQRADELAEFLAMYWLDGKKPLAKQVKKGLACAFGKFNEYALAKYNRDATVKLRDVLFMVHPKPKDKEQEDLWKRLVEGKLNTPDTWEVALSGGADKKQAFERLLAEDKLGYLALLRNLRNMQQAGVDPALVFNALHKGAANSKALPFRFIAAARAVPAWEAEIDKAMQVALAGVDKLPGSTALLIDVSGSMKSRLSKNGDLSRLDAAAALAILVRGICENVRIFTFSNDLIEVAPRQGMALADAVIKSQEHGGTYLGRALKTLNSTVNADRLIVITDEQSHDQVDSPTCKGYMINVATYKNGIDYGDWVKISGFSESVINYIAAAEK